MTIIVIKQIIIIICIKMKFPVIIIIIVVITINITITITFITVIIFIITSCIRQTRVHNRPKQMRQQLNKCEKTVLINRRQQIII